MYTLWMISVAVVLASMLPSCRPTELRRCNLKECKKNGGAVCALTKCTTDATNCGGKSCSGAKREVCIDNMCVSRSKNCRGKNKDGAYVRCAKRGEQCGEDQFCVKSYGTNSKCVNGVCRKIGGCSGKSSGTDCKSGFCSGGVCLEQCSKDKALARNGDEYCAEPKCGESFCL